MTALSRLSEHPKLHAIARPLTADGFAPGSAGPTALVHPCQDTLDNQPQALGQVENPLVAHERAFREVARYNVLAAKGIGRPPTTAACNLDWEEATATYERLSAENTDRGFGGTVFWRQLINEAEVLAARAAFKQEATCSQRL